MLFIVLIFVGESFFDSAAKIYLWLAAFGILGLAALTLGLFSQRGKNKLSLTGLVGTIISVLIIIICLIIGAYYIKIRATINSLSSDSTSSGSYSD